MAIHKYRTSIVQGFNFDKDNQNLVGHITELKIGTESYDADLKVQDPTKIGEGTKVAVVGVVSAIRWDGGFTDPVTFTSQVSYEGSKRAAIQVYKELSDTTVELKFDIYKYDPKDKKYYKCFHCGDETLKGLIEKNNGNLEMEIDLEEQNADVPSPINFELYLSVMPQEEEQAIHIAISIDTKLAKKWGVPGPAGG